MQIFVFVQFEFRHSNKLIIENKKKDLSVGLEPP